MGKDQDFGRSFETSTADRQLGKEKQGLASDCLFMSVVPAQAGWDHGMRPGNSLDPTAARENDTMSPDFDHGGRDGIIHNGDRLMSTKSSIYKFLRLWNDVSAVKKGKVGKRIGQRLAGKTTGRLLRKLFK